MADFTVDQLNEFDNNGDLSEPLLLARAYLYAALIRVVIGDAYDNFVISDRNEAGNPIGSENMFTFYDQAISNLVAAEAIARSLGELPEGDADGAG